MSSSVVLTSKITMANDFSDPLSELKGLAQLKGQRAEIQKRMENEMQTGIPQGRSFLDYPFLKGFLICYVVAGLHFSDIIGVVLGALSGNYAAQTYQVLNIEKTIEDCLNCLKNGPSN